VGDGDDTDRDAFGQPLSGGGTAAASATPTAAPPPRAAVQERRTPRSSPLPLIFTIVAIAVTGLVLYRADHDAVDSPAVVTRELGNHALGARSLVRAENFRRAVAAIQAEVKPNEDVLSLRLTPQEVSSIARDPNGNTRFVDVGVDFKVDTNSWSTDTTSTPLDLAAIDPAVPQKIVRAALHESGADDTHLNYVSLTGNEDPTWYISLDDVPIGKQTWSADLAGIYVGPPGQLPPASGLTGRSLLREANLASALEKVSQYGRQVTDFRLQPDRLDVVLRGDGRTQAVTIDAAQRVTARDSPGANARDAVRLDQIDPAAPARAVSIVAERGGVSPRKINYVVLFSADEWGLYYKDVPENRDFWRANGHGRQVVRQG
jgi:hypothetical protein